MTGDGPVEAGGAVVEAGGAAGGAVVEVLHGHRVEDPYRWLEDSGSDEVAEWSRRQDHLARQYLDGLPDRAELRRQLEAFGSPGFVGVPLVRGDRAFYLRRRPGEERMALAVREADGSEYALVDPNAGAEGGFKIGSWQPSLDGGLLAYQSSRGGREESSLVVIDADSRELVDGPVDRVVSAAVAWLPDGTAYYYVRRLPPEAVPRGEEQFHHRVWRHTVGTRPEQDELVFGEGRGMTDYYTVALSRDGRWLIILVAPGTAVRNDLYVLNVEDGRVLPVVEGEDARSSAVIDRRGRLFVLTTLQAPRGRLVTAPTERPGPEHWTELVGEGEPVLRGFTLTDDAIVLNASRHAVSEISVLSLDGRPRQRVGLPGLGDCTGPTSRPQGGDDVWFGYRDFWTPSRVYRLRVGSEDLHLWAEQGAGRTVGDVTAEQVTCASRDGTPVRMFLLRRADLELDGRRPAVLVGYGGFGVGMQPSYDPVANVWVAAGGVYAVANVRGGNEEGRAWHDAGRRQHKQKSFDDFIAAAEWLCRNRVTSPEHLAISGISNGGLLVGAALTQRPELFSAAHCGAPLLDMVRYEQFGLGRLWTEEYGRAADPEELGWLLAYSPYHRVRPGTSYPAVLLTTFENDARVHPMHARKLCAVLQRASTSGRPVLLRHQAAAGHLFESMTSSLEIETDVLTFMAANTGLWPSRR